MSQQEKEKKRKSKAQDLKKLGKHCDYCIVPLQWIKPNGIFFLKGQLCIETNQLDHSHFSSMNYYQQISNIVIQKDIKMIIIDFQTKSCELDSYDRVIQILQQSNNQCLNDLSQKLKSYEDHQNLGYQVKTYMKSIAHSNIMMQKIISQKRLEFEQFRIQKIKSLSNEKYFSFIDFSYDYSEMEINFIGQGMNETMSQLLGADLESLQQIFMRKGILNFVEKDCKLQLISKMIEDSQQFYEGDTQCDGTISLITLDEIQIDSSFSADIYFCHSYNAFYHSFDRSYKKFLFDRGFVIVELNITNFHINKINGIRMNQKSTPMINTHHQTLVENTENKPILLDKLVQNSNQALISSFTITKETNSIHLEDEMIQEEEIPFKNNQKKEDNQLNTFLHQQLVSNELNEAKQKGNLIHTSKTPVENLLQDIPYSVYSQHFIEKYYEKEISNNISYSSINSQNQEFSKRCGYKIINA